MRYQAFYQIEDFPALKALVENWQIVRDEFMGLDAPLLDINRVGKEHDEVYTKVMKYMEAGGTYGWLQGWGDNGVNPDWLQYGLVMFDSAIPYAKATMPKTIELLDNIQGIKVCALVTLKSNSFIGAHRHPEIEEEDLLQLHITLDASAERNFAYLNVNGEFRQHVSGSAFIFDGSLYHFAINASSYNRTILYMEFKQ